MERGRKKKLLLVCHKNGENKHKEKSFEWEIANLFFLLSPRLVVIFCSARFLLAARSTKLKTVISPWINLREIECKYVRMYIGERAVRERVRRSREKILFSLISSCLPDKVASSPYFVTFQCLFATRSESAEWGISNKTFQQQGRSFRNIFAHESTFSCWPTHCYRRYQKAFSFLLSSSSSTPATITSFLQPLTCQKHSRSWSRRLCSMQIMMKDSLSHQKSFSNIIWLMHDSCESVWWRQGRAQRGGGGKRLLKYIYWKIIFGFLSIARLSFPLCLLLFCPCINI